MARVVIGVVALLAELFDVVFEGVHGGIKYLRAGRTGRQVAPRAPPQNAYLLCDRLRVV